MDKNSLDLFKQAISEGLSERFDSVVESCTDKIVCSDHHKIAMRTIVYGKAEAKRAWSPKMKRIIAILVAAALLLTSCGIIFRNEIREVFEEFFVQLSYVGDENSVGEIEEVYELNYLPKGYYLEQENISYTTAKFKYINSERDYIYFEQRILNETNFFIDNESGYSKIEEIEAYDIYYRYTGESFIYLWNDGKYSLSLRVNNELPNEEIILILNGTTLK